MQPTRRGVLKSLALSPVLLSPALLSACGGGSSSKAGTLNVGQISDSVAFFPLFIAEKLGYFKDESLKLGERPRLGTGAKVAAALKSGSIDLGGGVMTDALNLAEIDTQARLTTSLISAYYVDIVVGKSLSSSGGGSLTSRVSALKGKKIGITGPGSGTEALVTFLFKQAGLDPAKDAVLVNLGAVASAAVGALKAGRVDALSFFQPIGQQAEAAGVGSIYISPAAGDVPSLDSDLHGVVFSRQSIIDAKTDEVDAFQSAISRSLGVVRGDASRARELLGEYLDGTPDAALDKLVPILQRETSTKPTIIEKQYDVARTFHVDSKLVEKAPSYSAIVPSKFRA